MCQSYSILLLQRYITSMEYLNELLSTANGYNKQAALLDEL